MISSIARSLASKVGRGALRILNLRIVQLVVVKPLKKLWASRAVRVVLRIVKPIVSNASFLSLALIILIALIVPEFTRDPIELNAGPRRSPPGRDFWFGTDEFGYDVFARVVHAARLDLAVGFGAALIAVAIGVPLGALAAMKGGKFDGFLLRISESFQAFPTLLLAMGIVAAFDASIPNLIFIIALVNIPVYIRLTRSAVLPIVDSDFILASRCAGKRNFTILRRRVIPNVSQVIFAQFSVNVAWAVLILAALSYIGLGVSLPTPEWGAMVRAGARYITLSGQWWMSVFPGLAIFATVLSLNLVADRVRYGK